MNRDEFERLKEAEKEHLRKVRELKAQLKDARRHRGVADALRSMDTADLDHEFERALREVEQQNVSAEARYEMALGALDEAAERERSRLELERFEAEQSKAAATDLVSRLKAELSEGTHVESGTPDASRAQPDSPSPTTPDDDAPPQGKTIGRSRSRPK